MVPPPAEEIVLGFDLRADPRAVWADRGARPGEFFLRDVAQPLAADSSVWQHRPGDSLQAARSFVICGWRFWSVEAAREEADVGQVIVAVTVHLAGLDQMARDYWHRVAWVGLPPDPTWQRLGYDVGDQSCLSGLSNCGYGAERAVWAGAWGGDINEHHLVSTPARAEAMALAMNARVPEHAPFAALGLYLVEAIGDR